MEKNNSTLLTASNSKEPHPAKRKWSPNKILSVILAILGVVIVMLIIGGGAMLASHVWNPKWNPFKQAPDQGIRQKIFRK